MPGLERTGLEGSHLCALTENKVGRTHDGALQILAQTGIVVQDDGVLTLLGEAGCQVNREERHAQIPAQVIEEAVAKAPPLPDGAAAQLDEIVKEVETQARRTQ